VITPAGGIAGYVFDSHIYVAGPENGGEEEWRHERPASSRSSPGTSRPTQLDSGGKLTRASVGQSFSGDIEGEGAVEWLMCYREDGTAHIVGLQRITGRIGGRSGSVVLETTGKFDGQEAKGSWTVVPGSAGGDLRGLRGSGEATAPLGTSASFTLDYDFE
jgi:hypothetical protein